MKAAPYGIIVAAALSGALISPSAEARSSTPTEFRGYTVCTSAVKDNTSGLVTARSYFIDRTDAGNRYYINATHWQDGGRAALAVACETTRNGRDLVALDMREGRYTNREGNVRIEVAAN